MFILSESAKILSNKTYQIINSNKEIQIYAQCNLFYCNDRNYKQVYSVVQNCICILNIELGSFSSAHHSALRFSLAAFLFVRCCSLSKARGLFLAGGSSVTSHDASSPQAIREVKINH